MARSIHSNRSQRLWEKTGCVEWEDIFRKRMIKKSVKDERRKSVPADSIPSMSPEVVIEMKDEHPCLYFPVSKNEMREVLDALPPGILDGLAAVILEAGTAYMNNLPKEDLLGDADEDEIILDPFLGRRSFEISPEVYLPVVKGTYSKQANVVRIFGIAAKPSFQFPPGEKKMLRFEMMKTLLHEVAHHHDRSRRMARGRWLMDVEEKYEQYAKKMARKWGEDVLASYIEDLVAEILKGFEDKK